VYNPVATTEGTDSYWIYNYDKFDDASATTFLSTPYSTTGQLVIIEGLITPAATQSVYPCITPEAVAGTLTIKANLSHVLWREL
jgi:hypothetical protein